MFTLRNELRGGRSNPVRIPVVKEQGYTPVVGEPPVQLPGAKGVNPEWVTWYRRRKKVTNNIAINIGKRIIKEINNAEQ